MSDFGSSALTSPVADPTKRVNYVLGMVLGVDDFNQEHAWLSERDQWLARDLLGYGTIWGLQVTTPVTDRGPEVRVSGGAALTPRGRLVRVAPPQCAALNDWLAAHAREVGDRLGSPPGTLRLHLVLCFDECLTDPVPVPGEPCRSEEDATAPSRVADDFRLELRFDPPDQREEDAVRDLAAWLQRKIEVVPDGDPASSVDDLLAALRGAALPASPPADPSGSPPDFPSPPSDFLADDSPAGVIPIRAGDLVAALRAAHRVWVTELRPMWRPTWLGDVHSCDGPASRPVPPSPDCLLLAAVDVPVTRELEGGPWEVSSEIAIGVDEERRPFLLDLRLLQEWMLRLSPQPGVGPTPPLSDVPGSPPQAPYAVVAAGILRGDGTSGGTYNGLQVAGVADGRVAFTFAGYAQPPSGPGHRYLVHALVGTSADVKAPVVTLGGFEPGGLVLNVGDGAKAVKAAAIAKLSFSVEVSQFAVP